MVADLIRVSPNRPGHDNNNISTLYSPYNVILLYNHVDHPQLPVRIHINQTIPTAITHYLPLPIQATDFNHNSNHPLGNSNKAKIKNHELRHLPATTIKSNTIAYLCNLHANDLTLADLVGCLVWLHELVLCRGDC